jgi:hypothetical protein
MFRAGPRGNVGKAKQLFDVGEQDSHATDVAYWQRIWPVSRERPPPGKQGTSRMRVWVEQPSSLVFAALAVCAALGVALWMFGY